MDTVIDTGTTLAVSVFYLYQEVCKMYQVLKRDGGTVEFEISKISTAMLKAFDALGKQYHPSIINLLAIQVCADFESKVKNDLIAVEDIQQVVWKLKDRNIGILITDHNVYETLSICDRAYLLFEGKVLFQGTAEQLAENEIVREKYLGKDFVLRRRDL